MADESRKYTPPRVRTLIAFSTLIMLLFSVFVAYQASKAYDKAVLEGKLNAERLARIVTDEVELTFLTVDLTLRRAVERHYFNMLFGGNLPNDIEHNFRLWVEETPQIVAMMLVNPQGTVEIAAHMKGYEGWFDYYRSLENDPMMQAMRDSDERQFYIQRWQTDNPEHETLVLLARKITKIDGSFGGIVIAAVDPQLFLTFFTSIEFGIHRFLALMLTDGSVLYNGASPEVESAEVLDYVSQEVRDNPDPHFVTTTSRDFKESIKIYSYKQIRNLPLVAMVVLDEEDFLAGWHDARIKDISFLAIFTIFGSVLSFFALTMAKQIVRVEESEAAAILASQAKSEFLANMSHELRTPLNAVIGFSEMLNAGYFGELNDKQKERIQDINLCGTHLLQLISDILEFSKGEAGRLELNEETVNLPEIISECQRIIHEKAKSKRIVMEVDVVPNLPELWGDKRKIRQIVLNLISNSIKFTPRDGTIRIRGYLDDHKQVNLVITDTGIGIAEEDIPVALSVFGQVHRDHSHEGTGLGLPLCKMFTELHGGKMSLTSKVGEGTSVRLVFPKERNISLDRAQRA